MGEIREKVAEEIFEAIMTENFPKVMSDTKLQIQEAWRTHKEAYHIQTSENQR